ncbi:hypothetical protein MJO28_004977 [Puccinia striiformis f. sp. tritici]|uniref:Splicing factor YJU2 n=3 Tax=Puccinia striiformis TaxID=27350 RepID=A0A0L0VCS8_9BASI|nr:hypothetical protein Pst134EA_009158 [Puccinia striiformis f. sp. tritici]KNE96789.1 hypothetical protein PSTG_09924 [Puccinia striiformis f. sp. tritici PST-78]POW23419.1 hypothetical protein PSHT_00189 [Puccinia striiformis]KAH9457911.1 hypothetical protein Pst134EB_010217 [Puccinia striiformis f. sp. tritici]KAH9468623.1 hypothetical protein Pst134EA_009158 [Puccinia striiformis f. sp. tritici]KAI7954577.1 hypothetical protein MJO28_004977 [Puccinia striiformis f. sp. tritici]
MSERKVLNKYFPPDFDPAKIPRRKLAKDRQQVVRLMAPFSMQCLSCTEFIYKGKKFNARKEAALGEQYFGIKIFRFYIKCPRCSNEITFKTDPKHSDYVAEHGAQRNFEPWREEEAAKNGAGSDSEDDVERLLAVEQAELEEEQEDSMRSLEKNQIESKREMEILDKLQEIRTRNARLERSVHGRGADGVLASVSSRVQSGLAGAKEVFQLEQQLLESEEDDAETAKYFTKVNNNLLPSIKEDDGPTPSGSGNEPETIEKEDPLQSNPESITIKRKFTDVEPDIHSLLSDSSKELLASNSSSFTKLPPKKKKNSKTNSFGIKIIKKS